MIRTCYFVLLCCCLGCENREEKIARWQNTLLAALGEREYFVVEVKEQAFKWPLPPDPSKAEENKNKLVTLKAEIDRYCAEHADWAKDPDAVRIRGYLEAIVGKDGFMMIFNPEKCVPVWLSEDRPSSGEYPPREITLQKTPEYYAEVERRWQPVDPALAKKAAERCLPILDALEAAGEESRVARYAVKDFVGLCLSAVAD